MNPWNTEDMAEAIHEAVTMSPAQRESNHHKLYRYVTKYTAAYWGESFVNELKRVSKEYDLRNTLPKLKPDVVQAAFSSAQRKVGRLFELLMTLLNAV